MDSAGRHDARKASVTPDLASRFGPKPAQAPDLAFRIGQNLEPQTPCPNLFTFETC
jgi:hypothetical protein